MKTYMYSIKSQWENSAFSQGFLKPCVKFCIVEGFNLIAYKFTPLFYLIFNHKSSKLKPCHSSRGRGIKVKKSIDEIAKYAQEIHDNQEKSQKDPTVLVQRYVEKPLIVHGRKFDIRQWFLVTSFDPVKDWIDKN